MLQSVWGVKCKKDNRLPAGLLPALSLSRPRLVLGTERPTYHAVHEIVIVGPEVLLPVMEIIRTTVQLWPELSIYRMCT